MSFGPDDGSDIRSRLIGAFDRFPRRARAAATARSRRCCATLEDRHRRRSQGLHAGFAAGNPCAIGRRRSRSAISAIPAPSARISSTTSSPIATVAPFDHAPFYAEKIVQLPGLLSGQRPQARDRRDDADAARRPACRTTGFVFCCFNNNYKIRRPVFDVWMRLLAAGARQRAVAAARQSPAPSAICAARPRRAASIRRGSSSPAG